MSPDKVNITEYAHIFINFCEWYRSGIFALVEAFQLKKLSAGDSTSKTAKKFDPSDLDVIASLASGAFGSVSLIKMEKSFTPFALKTIAKSSILKDKQISHILNEKFILSLFSDFHKGATKAKQSEDFGPSKQSIIEYSSQKQYYNKYIVQLYETFQDQNNLYFLMEYLPGGELAYLFNKHRIHMKLDDIKVYLCEVIIALEELHCHNIVYRDLKLENIVIDKSGHIKLVDFGFAKKLGSSDRTYTQCGTQGYIAPEISKNFGHGLPADIWSLGMLF